MIWQVPLLIVLGLYMTNAWAHESWINKGRMTDPASGEWCCNNIDCRAEQVTEVFGGYLTQARDVVPYSRVIWKSPDGMWWRCRKYTNGQESTRCLIGPPPGS